MKVNLNSIFSPKINLNPILLLNLSRKDSFSSYLKQIKSAKGPLTLEEANLLFKLASEVSKGCILEIGSYRGRSAVALALGTQHSNHHVPVYAVEPHEAFTGALGGEFGPQDRVEFFKNMLKTHCAKTVRLINLSSEVVSKGWQQAIGLLWIDGDHTYEATRRDFDCWAPFVLPGAKVAFHDSLDEKLGPIKVIGEILSAGGYQEYCQVGHTTVLQKSAAS
jgi:hypothetical protein